jgi:hypothetical protein
VPLCPPPFSLQSFSLPTINSPTEPPHLSRSIYLISIPLSLSRDRSVSLSPSFFLSSAPCFSLYSQTRELTTLLSCSCLYLNPRGASELLPHLSPPFIPYHFTAIVAIILWSTTHQPETCRLPSIKGSSKPPLSPCCLCSHALRNFIFETKKKTDKNSEP